MTEYRLPKSILEATFALFRECGRGRHECQALWLSSWESVGEISELVHPKHRAHGVGFSLDDQWLTAFWLRLVRKNIGVRIQVHTHPQMAFHSKTDDDYPIIHTPGFLSLVIPDFAMGKIGFEGAYLTEIQQDGSWKQASISETLIFT